MYHSTGKDLHLNNSSLNKEFANLNDSISPQVKEPKQESYMRLSLTLYLEGRNFKFKCLDLARKLARGSTKKEMTQNSVEKSREFWSKLLFFTLGRKRQSYPHTRFAIYTLNSFHASLLNEIFLETIWCCVSALLR